VKGTLEKKIKRKIKESDRETNKAATFHEQRIHIDQISTYMQKMS
jgi:hypothetical protein